jgi:autotransporter-associated beta strand protein
MRNKGLLFMAGIIAFFLQPSCHSQTIAFPGAIGFGSYATGGRNGSVYHVTTLADSGAGSFRDAVSSGNRTIVFDVGGIVNLSSAISCSSGLTIAGQTAPGGIVFNGGEISFANRNNIICRYIRIRPGSSTTSSTDDALSFYRASNVIVDHTSIAFAPWNNIDGVGDSTHVVTSITVQNSINANPTGQQFGAHTESVGGQWSWFYNIFANSHNRNPLAKINTVYINNVDYNCSAGYTTHTSTRFKHDIVNNYFVAGPAYSTSSDFPWFQVDNNQSIYYSSNYFDSNENGSLDGGITTPYWYQGGTGTILSSPWSSWTTVVPVASAALAWRFDVSAAGAFPRDEVDALLINQVKTMGSGSVGTTAGTAGPGSGLYTSQSQTGLGNNGYGTITGGVAPANFSGDGIADYWKLATGLNTNTSYPLTNTATGYTLLENYLNFLAAPHAVTQTNTPVDVNLSQLSGGFTSGATFSVTNATNGTITLLNGTNAHFVPAGNFSGTGSFSYSVSESGNAISATVTVCITPVVPPAAAASFNGALVVIAASTAATSTSPPSNLTWRGDGIANVWSTAVSNWLNGANVASFKNGDVCTYDDTGSRTPAINLTSALSPGAIFFNHSLNYTLSGSGAISGSGPFSKSGSGTLTIATTNTGFSGSINVAGGSLSLNTGTSMGSGAVTINDGATLSLASGSSAINIPGSITVPVGAVATINSGYVANGGYGNFISGDSTSVLNLVGNQSLGGANTNQFNSFKGTINISSGSIRFSTASSGNTFGSLNPNFIINGTFQPRNAGNTVVLGALNGSGQLAGPQTAGTGSGSTVYIIGGKNQDAVFTGSIVSNANSAGSLICFNKVGSGIQSLMGSNTFGGTNGVLAGTLLVNGSTMPSLTTVFSNATLGGSGIINGSVSVNSGGILSPGSTSPGILTINGNLTNNSPILNFRLSGSPAGTNDGINMTGNLEMNGAQSYNFILTDTALGAGTYSLIEGANNSTTTGVTFSNNLPANTRQNISMISAVPGSNPSYVRLAVTGSAASLVWRGTNGVNWDAGSINWINGSSPDAYYNLDSVVFDDSGYNPSSVTLASVVTPASMIVNSTQNYVFSGSGSLSGQGGLTKLGTSTLTISTSNTNYTGTMNLFGGTLAATTGGALGNGALTISNGSTLSLTANGTIFFGGSVTIPSNTSGNIYSGTLANGISGNLYSGNSNSVLYISNGVSFSGTNTGQFDGFTGILNILPGATLRYSANFSGKTFGSLSPYMVINGTLQPRNAGNTIQLGALTGSGVIAGPHAASGTGDTLYVIGGNNSDSTFTGVISSNSMVVGSRK